MLRPSLPAGLSVDRKGSGEIGKTKKITLLGLMLAMIIVLSMLEHMLPPIPFMPPGARLGLANVVVMYVLLFIGSKEAFALNIMKSGFVFLSRGAIAFALSFCGGVLSLCLILAVLKLSRNKASYVMISVSGAVTHNIGQLIALAAILRTISMIYYAPALLIFGIALGIITSVVLRVALPVLNRTLKGKR